MAHPAKLDPQPTCVCTLHSCCPTTAGCVPRTLHHMPPAALAHAGGRSTSPANAPPPFAQWAPTVTFLVHPTLQDPSIAHLVQVHPGPLVILTIVSALQPLLQMLPGPMNTLAIRHQVLLWDTSVVHTLPSQDHFQ